MAEKHIYVDNEKLAYFYNKLKEKFVNADSILHLKATIPSIGWSSDETGSHIDVDVQGILETDTPIVDIVQTGESESDATMRNAWVAVTRITTSSDKITVYADQAPEVELPIQLEVVR